LVKLTKSTDNRLLFDVNLQLRFGQQWDPNNAIELFEFCASQGFCDNVDWELGNGWLLLKAFYYVICYRCSPFSAMTLLVGWQEGHPASKKLDVGRLMATIWLELCASYVSSWHHHPP